MKFDESYELLADLYADGSFQRKQTDKLKNALKQAISALEQGQREPSKVQKILAKVTAAADTAFPDSKAEVRDILAADVMYILEWFEIDLDVEDVFGK